MMMKGKIYMGVCMMVRTKDRLGKLRIYEIMPGRSKGITAGYHHQEPKNILQEFRPWAYTQFAYVAGNADFNPDIHVIQVHVYNDVTELNDDGMDKMRTALYEAERILQEEADMICKVINTRNDKKVKQARRNRPRSIKV